MSSKKKMTEKQKREKKLKEAEKTKKRIIFNNDIDIRR